MKIILITSLLIMASCQTPTAREIADYVNRPDLDVPCIANGDGTCFRDGEIEETTNMLCGRGSEYDVVQDHLEAMERWVYNCRKFKRCN